MDGIHDLGGKLGFGPIEISGEEEPPFHAGWEGRMWGIAFAYTRPADFNSPKFRYTRELETPLNYLSRPYLDQWYQAHACMLLGAGLVSIEELARGVAAEPAPRVSRPAMSARDVHRIKHRTPPSLRSDEVAPRYAVGERVRARLAGIPGHSRLPAYVRGHHGTITTYHGGHPLDDAAAAGEVRVEPLYTVVFLLGELFPERATTRDRVHLDLWQSHLQDAE